MIERPLLGLALVPDDDRWVATLVDADDRAEHLGPLAAPDLADRLGAIDVERRPRWLWWGHEAAVAAVTIGLRPSHCWELAAVHRLLDGGGRSDPPMVWAAAHGLDTDRLPEPRPDDLFHAFDDHDPEHHLDEAGYLDPAWVAGDWSTSAERRATWLRAAHDVHRRQAERISAIVERPGLAATARAESAAALLAAELEVDGLPFDRTVGDELVAGFVGPRPRSADEERAMVAARDAEVLRHVPDGTHYDLRSPEQVRSLLRRCGIEVPDTRSWRLEQLLDAHPVVAPLLDWRRAERIATTFGHRWMDEHVGTGPEGHDRLRGRWSSSDGAAGRMTASAGLHNLPAELRPAIAADPGHVIVRADLGQIEPRVLASISGDESLARATIDDDLYAPVASRLGVDRDIAKVAVLGAMYGQTTGVGAAALRGLEREYPVAMGFLHDADRAAQRGEDLRTIGGRLVRLSSVADDGLPPDQARTRAAARGRFGRNAMVQGAAAEFFKVWAVLVRSRVRPLGARIVLCLHDELLVHAPEANGREVGAAVDACVEEAAARWSAPAAPAVRFVADTSVVRRWSEAK